jgi:hypothetical protein
MSMRFQGSIILILIIIGIPIYIVYIIFTTISTIISENIIIISAVALSGLFVFIAYQLYSEIYFKSKRFNGIKKSINEHITNCNELNHYIEVLKGSYINIESYNYGSGKIIDNSNYNFERREWSKVIRSNKIHHCSATVCKNANSQPIKYLCKYFGIGNNEESLSKFEKVLNDFISVEQGKDLIKRERESILSRISKSIPFLIRQFSKNKLARRLGFETVDISDAYIPTFAFQYVSPGGNSSLRCDIKLNIDLRRDP